MRLWILARHHQAHNHHHDHYGPHHHHDPYHKKNTSSSVGFCPIALITPRSSCAEIAPLPSCSRLFLSLFSGFRFYLFKFLLTNGIDFKRGSRKVLKLLFLVKSYICKALFTLKRALSYFGIYACTLFLSKWPSRIAQ